MRKDIFQEYSNVLTYKLNYLIILKCLSTAYEMMLFKFFEKFQPLKNLEITQK